MIDYTKPNKNKRRSQTASHTQAQGDTGSSQATPRASSQPATQTASATYASATPSAAVERSILRNVYIWMTIGLAITGIVAWFSASSELVLSLVFGSGFGFLGLVIAQLAFVWVLSAKILTLKPQTAVLLFLGYSALTGVTLSSIFWYYDLGVIGLAFLTTAGMFGGMSLWAVTTKKDLSGWGNFLIMGLWGMIIASVVNIFIGSSALYYGMSYIGVALFLGLTAYDTFVIKRWYQEMADRGDEALYTKLSIMGALKLYLDFINIFLYLLRILSRKR